MIQNTPQLHHRPPQLKAPPWPSRSPDLDISRDLWSDLRGAVRAMEEPESTEGSSEEDEPFTPSTHTHSHTLSSHC